MGETRYPPHADAQKRYREKRANSPEFKAREKAARERANGKLQAELRDDPADPRHGSAGAYNNGRCRCVSCVQAMRDNAAKRKATVGALFREDLSDPRHGTLNGYCNLACRCEKCRAGYKAYYEQRKARGRDE